MAIPFLKPLEQAIRRILIGSNRLFKGVMISSIEDAPILPSNPRILIIRPDKLGDMLITLPTIKAIREAYPEAHIDILAGKVNLPLRDQLLIYADECLLYDKTIRGILSLYFSLPKKKYDIAIDPLDNPSTTSGYLIAMSKAKLKVGIHKSNAHVYTHCVIPRDRKNTHIVERTAQLLLAFGINPDELALDIPYVLSKSLSDESKQLLQKAGLDISKPVITINIAGALEARILRPESAIEWINTIKHFADESGIQVMICGEKKHEIALRIITKETGIFLAPFVQSYHAFAGLLSASSMLISPDTSVLHLISSWKIPCLAFFVDDRSNTAVWTPYASPHEYIITYTPSVNNIHSNEIISAFERLVKKTIFKSIEEQMLKNQ
jgi:ADP-heptose:LPS heptosyltransferase